MSREVFMGMSLWMGRKGLEFKSNGLRSQSYNRVAPKAVDVK